MTVDEMRKLLSDQIPTCGASSEGTTVLLLVASAGLDEVTWLGFLEKYMAPLDTLIRSGFTEILLDLFQAGFAVGKLSAIRQSQQASQIN